MDPTQSLVRRRLVTNYLAGNVHSLQETEYMTTFVTSYPPAPCTMATALQELTSCRHWNGRRCRQLFACHLALPAR